MEQQQNEPVTIFDGPNKKTKRTLIGIAAIIGIAGTFTNLPSWVVALANTIVSMSGGQY